MRCSLEHVKGFDVSNLPQASSTIAFLFLIHAVVLPMAQSLDGDMAQPKKFNGVVWRCGGDGALFVALAARLTAF